MNNFEKFNNKQISKKESSEIMGGDYQVCLNASGPGGFCLSWTYQVLIGDNCFGLQGNAKFVCWDQMCDLAMNYCVIE
ncbi:hypothetical protein [Roseivirga sp. E12]|uniref:hypothetical protein n=1 Tax=Roseivirga sp. E12 TaxID=2819237 RepID=UPI001ABBF910|nr:hypothetical protein [Roseivirga sp. E12]